MCGYGIFALYLCVWICRNGYDMCSDYLTQMRSMMTYPTLLYSVYIGRCGMLIVFCGSVEFTY
jgi:hypothetical protein